MCSMLMLSPDSRDIAYAVGVSRRHDDGDDPELVATIAGATFSSMSPSAEDMMFYDVLYSERDTPVGMEPRILEDGIRSLFVSETAGWEGVTMNGAWPRVRLGPERSGSPKPGTVELFGDAWLCRPEAGHWAIALDLDGAFFKNIDLGVLRRLESDGPGSAKPLRDLPRPWRRLP